MCIVCLIAVTFLLLPVLLGISCVDERGEPANITECLRWAGPVPPQMRECRVPCKDDCILTAWSRFSDCAGCGSSRSRKRSLTGKIFYSQFVKHSQLHQLHLKMVFYINWNKSVQVVTLECLKLLSYCVVYVLKSQIVFYSKCRIYPFSLYGTLTVTLSSPFSVMSHLKIGSLTTCNPLLQCTPQIWSTCWSGRVDLMLFVIVNIWLNTRRVGGNVTHLSLSCFLNPAFDKQT